MCCPFAKRCPTFESFTSRGSEHLAWAFCFGEHRDCDRYKSMIAGEPAEDGEPSYSDQPLVAEKERILSRLRASLRDPRTNA